MSTKREQYLALEKGMGVPVPELDIGSFSDEMVYIWDAYAALRRGSEGKVTFRDMQAYCELYNVHFNPFETDVIVDLERLYWKVYSE